jgi:hypothetical protein
MVAFRPAGRIEVVEIVEEANPLRPGSSGKEHRLDEDEKQEYSQLLLPPATDPSPLAAFYFPEDLTRQPSPVALAGGFWNTGLEAGTRQRGAAVDLEQRA